MSVRKQPSNKLFSMKMPTVLTMPTIISSVSSMAPSMKVPSMKVPSMKVLPAMKKFNKQIQHTTGQVFSPLTSLTSQAFYFSHQIKSSEDGDTIREAVDDESIGSKEEETVIEIAEEVPVPRDPLLCLLDDAMQQSTTTDDEVQSVLCKFFHERYDEHIVMIRSAFGLEVSLEAYSVLLGHVFNLKELPNDIVAIALDEVDDYIFPRLAMICHDLTLLTPDHIAKVLSWATHYRDHRNKIFPSRELSAEREAWVGQLASEYLEQGVHRQVKAMVANRLFLIDEDDVVKNQDGTLSTRLADDLAVILEMQLTVAQEALPASMLPDVLIGSNEELFNLVGGLMFHVETNWKTMEVERICAVLNDAQQMSDLCENLNETILIDVPEDKVKASEALLAEFSHLALHAAHYLCERIFLDMQEHLEAIGTQEWEEGGKMISIVVATLDDYFQDIKAWVPVDYFFPKILTKCLDLTLRFYVDSFFGNTMVNGLKHAPRAIQKLQLDWLSLWTFFGIENKHYHGRAGFYTKEVICHRLHVLEIMASLLESTGGSPRIQDDMVVMVAQFGDEVATAAIFHLFGLQRRRISASEAEQWHEAVALACEHATMQCGTVTPLYPLPDLRNSKYIQQMRESRRQTTNLVDLTSTNRLVRRRCVPKLGFIRPARKLLKRSQGGSSRLMTTWRSEESCSLTLY